MAGIDNTSYIHILKQLSGKSEEAICSDLLLAETNLKTRMRNGYDKGYFPDGSKKRTVFWPTTDSWRDSRNYHKEFEELDAQDLSNQAFPEDGFKNTLSFNSHAYNIFLEYTNSFAAKDGENALLTAREKISCCLEELATPEEYIHIIKKQQTIEALAKYIITSASDAKKLKDRQTQASKPQALHKKSPSRVELVSYDELLKNGLTADDISKNLVENDLALYPNINPLNESDTAHWSQYLKEYGNDYFHFMYTPEDKRIVGNWSFLPITEAEQEQVIEGKFLESSFDPSYTPFLFLPGEYYLYILNLSINEGPFRTGDNFLLLMNSLMDKLYYYAEQGIFFKTLYTNAFSKFSESVWRQLGFKHKIAHCLSGQIFELSMTEFPDNKYPKLKQIYKDHFKQSSPMEWVDDTVVKADLVESQIERAISDFILDDSYSYDSLEKILQELPLTREVAVALNQLTESYDGILELYDVLFDKYTRFLTNHELRKLIERAKNVWDPIIWKKWEM